MKIYARLYAMNYGTTYIRWSMRCRTELHLIMEKAAQGPLMPDARMVAGFPFMEK